MRLVTFTNAPADLTIVGVRGIEDGKLILMVESSAFPVITGPQLPVISLRYNHGPMREKWEDPTPKIATGLVN